MMHQPVDPLEVFSGRPHRATLIEKDEVMSLRIDLEVLSIDEIYEKYFQAGGAGEEG